MVSWTTQDSKVPRIGLQCRRFPPIRPKPGQKRHIGESAPWKRLDLVGWQLARARVFHRVFLVVDRARHETGQGPGHSGGHYQAILWLGAPALRPQLGQV